MIKLRGKDARKNPKKEYNKELKGTNHSPLSCEKPTVPVFLYKREAIARVCTLHPVSFRCAAFVQLVYEDTPMPSGFGCRVVSEPCRMCSGTSTMQRARVRSPSMQSIWCPGGWREHVEMEGWADSMAQKGHDSILQSTRSSHPPKPFPL